MDFNYKKWRNPYIDKIQELPEYVLSACTKKPSAGDLVVLSSYIQKYKSVYIEFGSGSGQVLTQLASLDSNSLYVGFELRFKRVYLFGLKAKRYNLSNLLIIKTDNKLAFSLFPENSVSGVYVYFPDPWEKRVWEKNYLLNNDNLNSIALLLKRDGILFYKTDHIKRFEQTQILLEANKSYTIDISSADYYKEITMNPHLLKQFPSLSIKSEFENLFLSKKIPICVLVAHKNIG